MFYHKDFVAIPDQIMADMPDLKEYQLKREENLRETRRLGKNSVSDEPVLNKKQEYHLFRKMNYLKYKELSFGSTRDHLILANIPLVIFCKDKFSYNHISYDDAISHGTEALCHLVDKFDWTRGNKFSTYAIRGLKNKLTRDMYASRNTQKSKFLDMPKKSLLSVDLQVRTIRNSDKFIGITAWDETCELKEIIKSLTERQKTILHLHIVEGLTFRSASKRVGACPNVCGFHFKRAIEIIRSQLPEFQQVQTAGQGAKS